jgi:hypothetical protein
MSFPNLPKIEIPQSSPNPHGVTIQLGHFDTLEVIVPPITIVPPFGFITVSVIVDGKPAHEVWVEPGDSAPVSIDIPPYALRCCWQTIEYLVTTVNGTEYSDTLRVLNDGV